MTSIGRYQKLLDSPVTGERYRRGKEEGRFDRIEAIYEERTFDGTVWGPWRPPSICPLPAVSEADRLLAFINRCTRDPRVVVSFAKDDLDPGSDYMIRYADPGEVTSRVHYGESWGDCIDVLEFHLGRIEKDARKP